MISGGDCECMHVKVSMYNIGTNIVHWYIEISQKDAAVLQRLWCAFVLVGRVCAAQH